MEWAEKLELAEHILTALHTHAAATHPLECCGILLGNGTQITAAEPTANIHPSPRTHFEIDPAALIAAHRTARAGGPQIIGYYHSHPHGPPDPSPTDQAMAAHDGRIWAIVGAGEIRFWRDAQSGFERLSCATVSR